MSPVPVQRESNRGGWFRASRPRAWLWLGLLAATCATAADAPRGDPPQRAAARPSIAKEALRRRIHETLDDWMLDGRETYYRGERMIRDALAGRIVLPSEEEAAVTIPQHVAMWQREFRPLAKTELRLVEMACRPTPPELERIAAAGQVAVDATAKQYAEWQWKRMQSIYHYWWQPYPSNAREVIQQAFAAGVKQVLSPQQAAEYRAAVEQRQQARRRAAVMCMAAACDRQLLLSPEQRARLIEILNARWQNEWDEYLEHMPHGETSYRPSIPHEKMLEVLTTGQQEYWFAWKERRYPHSGWSGYGILRPEGDPEEEQQQEEAEKAAAEAERAQIAEAEAAKKKAEAAKAKPAAEKPKSEQPKSNKEPAQPAAKP